MLILSIVNLFLSMFPLSSAGEMMAQASQWLEQQMHPTVIISAYRQALEDLIVILRDQISTPVDVTNKDEMLKIVKSCIGTKFMKKW